MEKNPINKIHMYIHKVEQKRVVLNMSAGGRVSGYQEVNFGEIGVWGGGGEFQLDVYDVGILFCSHLKKCP